jgi:acetolactate synthase-1/2/3 large subunit
VLSLPSTSPDAPVAIPVEAGVDAAALDRLQALLTGARAPIAIVGGSRWDTASRAAIHGFAERFQMPVVTSYRRGPLFDALHPCYAGDLGLGANPKLVARTKTADLILLLGGRLGDVPSQRYSLLSFPDPGVTLIHAHADPDELGRLYRPALAIPAAPRRLAPALAALDPPAEIAWAGQAEAAHADYLAWSDIPTPQPGGVNLGAVMVWLRGALGADAIVCNGAGAYALWLHRFYRFRALDAHIATTSATMGYGPPAAVAMQRLYPGRRVITLGGDGDFLMNGQEFATMVQYGLPIINIVIDNESYGSIRLAQEQQFPGRVTATDLKNPDFAAYARAFGGFGATVARTEDFPAAFAAAAVSGLPAILHLKVDPEAMTPGATLAQIRAAARGG